ncbi:hypothetical protein J4477_02935 [Candidatus Pacearchaeota archaeon]|nr:hypothetical protein [Candidatus Pacearchaeota archaeon]
MVKSSLIMQRGREVRRVNRVLREVIEFKKFLKSANYPRHIQVKSFEPIEGINYCLGYFSLLGLYYSGEIANIKLSLDDGCKCLSRDYLKDFDFLVYERFLDRWQGFLDSNHELYEVFLRNYKSNLSGMALNDG